MGMLCSWVYHIIFDGNILDLLTWENVGWVCIYIYIYVLGVNYGYIYIYIYIYIMGCTNGDDLPTPYIYDSIV